MMVDSSHPQSPVSGDYHVFGGDGQEYGPISGDQVNAWFQQGRLVLDSRIRRSNETAWLTLREIAELEAFLSLATVPPVITPYPSSPSSQMSPEDEAKAKRLVSISHVLGYGGLVMLIFGSIAASILFDSSTAAGCVALLGLITAVVGAIIGQVGRAMQGRAI